MRISRRGWGLGASLVLGLMVAGTASADDRPVLHVKPEVSDGGVRLELQANGPFEYTTFRASESLYVLDISGVSVGDAAGVRVVPSELIKSYRVSTYSSGTTPMVRIEVLLEKGVEPRVERSDAQDVDLVVSRSADAALATPAKGASETASATSAPVVRTQESAVVVPASSKQSEKKAGNFESINQVNLAENGNQTSVNVVASGPLSYHATLLEKPDRLVLDFDDAHLKTSTKHIASNLEPVREIRLAQFTPETSRVVIDMRQPARYNINTNGNTITIAFEQPTPTNSKMGSAPSSESNLTTTKAKAQPRQREEHAQAQPGQVPSPAVALPSTMTQNSALAAPAPRSRAQEASVPQAGSETGAVNSALAQSGASNSSDASSASSPMQAAPAVQPVSTPEPARRAAMPAVQTQPVVVSNGRYSGEPISVNLKDVDLRDFFRLIHEISGLNVVVDPSVKGSLTIVLDDVPWDQALDIVLHNNDLEKQLDGNVLRIATRETVRKEAEESRDLQRAQAEAADIVTTTRVLSYAKATTMATTLKKFLSSRGDILADDRSNTLIIRDIPSTLPVVDNLLRQLDKKSQQVEIEARVVAANRSFSRELGTSLGLSAGIGNSGVGGDSTVGASQTTFTPQPPVVVGTAGGGATGGAQIPLVTSLQTTVPTSGLQYLFSSPNFALDFVIDAAEQRGVGKLLSKPKVITQNNEKATVKQGTKIPVQTVINNTVSVQFVDAVLELDVTPQITA
ncbi:MAG TPA: AMIN domain-containing protein, partial [Candidatus Acidoferrales bacterium]|nr:AMIN domain-containing protein [Candidatus Acidoferrales bacterium]